MKNLFAFLTLFFLVTGIIGCVPPGYKSMDQIQREVALKRENNVMIAQSGANSVVSVPKLNKNYQKIIKERIGSCLKDSDSAKYRFVGNPVFCSFSNSNEFRGALYNSRKTPTIGYAGLVFVNAKNSFGGYTGEQPWFYIISGSEIDILATNEYGLWHSLNDVKNHLSTSYSECLLEIRK